jgi:hypothetical protein
MDRVGVDCLYKRSRVDGNHDLMTGDHDNAKRTCSSLSSWTCVASLAYTDIYVVVNMRGNVQVKTFVDVVSRALVTSLPQLYRLGGLFSEHSDMSMTFDMFLQSCGVTNSPSPFHLELEFRSPFSAAIDCAFSAVNGDESALLGGVHVVSSARRGHDFDFH